MPDRNDVVQRWLALWNGGLHELDTLVTDEIVVHAVLVGQIAEAPLAGREALRGWIATAQAMLPTVRFSVEVGPLVDGNMIAVRWRAEGPHGSAAHQLHRNRHPQDRGRPDRGALDQRRYYVDAAAGRYAFVIERLIISGHQPEIHGHPGKCDHGQQRVDGTLAAAIGIGLHLWFAGLIVAAVGHALAVWRCAAIRRSCPSRAATSRFRNCSKADHLPGRLDRAGDHAPGPSQGARPRHPAARGERAPDPGAWRRLRPTSTGRASGRGQLKIDWLTERVGDRRDHRLWSGNGLNPPARTTRRRSAAACAVERVRVHPDRGCGGRGRGALMESASWVPSHSTGYDALGVRLGCPCSRSDRFAITSHRSHNFVKLVSFM